MIITTQIESSTKKGVFYTVQIGNRYNRCSCPDFQFNRMEKGNCKHIEKFREQLKKGMEFEKPIMTAGIIRVQQAIKYFVKKYKAEILFSYIDLFNRNFVGKQVGSIVEIKGKRFMITFRPKGINYFEQNIPMTAINSSEAFWQKQNGIDRIVIFKLQNGELKALRFPIEAIWDYMNRNPKIKVEFKSAVPSENEPLFNIPLSLAEDFDLWFKEKK